MNSEVIILLSTIATGLLALMGLCVRYAFLSKCLKIKCCCCEVIREVNLEHVNKQMYSSEENTSNITNNSNDIL